MKHQTTETTTTQEPAHTYKKVIPQATGRIDIAVKLADDCRNGHADFSITGAIYEKDNRGRLVNVGGGCMHDDILRVWPEAAQFVALHLSDSNGAPVYAVENGFYHMHNEEHTPARRMEIAAEHFRTTPDNLARLFTAEDENHLRLMLEELGIVAKWKEDARAAIEKLEELTGQKWNHDYVWPRGQYTPLSKETKAVLLQRIAEGYYTPEAQAARAEAARLAKIEKKRQEIEADRQATIDKANKEAAVKLWILKKTEELKKANQAFLFDSDMVIFYTHSNTLAFNWQQYGARFTKENFALLVASVTPEDRAEMGCDVKFELK